MVTISNTPTLNIKLALEISPKNMWIGGNLFCHASFNPPTPAKHESGKFLKFCLLVYVFLISFLFDICIWISQPEPIISPIMVVWGRQSLLPHIAHIPNEKVQRKPLWGKYILLLGILVFREISYTDRWLMMASIKIFV